MRDIFTPDNRIPIRKVRENLSEPSLWKKRKPKARILDDFIEEFWFQDIYDCVLMIPWVYKLLESYIQQNDQLPSRNEFYKQLLTKVTRGKKKYVHDLYSIGLRFELMQQNQLPETKFKTELKKLNLKEITVDWLIEQKVVERVTEESDGKTTQYLKWFHHSFTEYLTADYLLNLDIPIADSLKKHAIVHLDEDNTDNIKPSWNGVLGFLLGSGKGKEVLDWVVSQIEHNSLNLFENLAKSIVKYAPSDVSDLMKDRVFNAIYGTIQERSIWIRTIPSHGLWRFYTNNQLHRLEIDCEDRADEVKTYVHKGNAVAYFTELIKHNKGPKDLKNKWKNRLIRFAKDKNTNGVLQRYTLGALELYQDSSILKKLRKFYRDPERMKDQLLWQAFIQFCASLKDKSNESIQILIDAAKLKMDIYGRHGLQEITQPKNIAYFLHALVRDAEFLERFIDSESIFSGESDEEGDRKLIVRIIKLSKRDQAIQKLLLRVIRAALRCEKLYNLDRSYIIRTFAGNFSNPVRILSKLLNDAEHAVKDHQNHFVYSLRELLPSFLTEKNWRKILALISKNSVYEKNVDDLVYRLRWSGDAKQKELFAIIAKERNLPIVTQKQEQDEQKEKKDKLYKEFQFKLEPEKGQFMTDVFEFYVHNEKELKPLKKKDRDRLLFLCYDDGVKRLDPNDFNITLIGFPQQKNQFTWTRQAAYYGDMIRILELLSPTKLKDRIVQQHLIDFIPFAYNSDVQTICKHVKKINEEQLSTLNRHIETVEDHRRYHHPDSYVSFVEYLSKKNDVHFCIPALRSLVGGENIDQWISVKALKVSGDIESVAEDYKQYLNDTFDKFEKKDSRLAEEANRQLIEKYLDITAIKWRIKQIKSRAMPFKPSSSGEVHSIGSDEEEYVISMSFAKPLMNVVNASIFRFLINLYKSGMEKAISDSSFETYRAYLWKILIAYLSNQNFRESVRMQSLLTKKDYLSSWQKEELRQLRLDQINRSITPY